MIWLILAALAVLLCFAGVLLVGAPYLPTLTPQIHTALELADAKPGQTLLELGCGDGKVLIAAAQVGLHAVGYELNPILALLSWLRTRRFGKNVTVVWGDFWRQEWPETDIIFTFLLDRYMERLDKNIIQYKHKPIKLVSFAFRIPNREAATYKRGVYLYEYK
jgi:SAM-dependent methyltransferase